MPSLSCHNSINVCLFKAVEVGGYADSVSAHVVDEKPVAHVQLRNPVAFGYFVDAVAGWTPDDGAISRFALLNSLQRGYQLRYIKKKKTHNLSELTLCSRFQQALPQSLILTLAHDVTGLNMQKLLLLKAWMFSTFHQM